MNNQTNIHPTAKIDPTATIALSARIGARTVIGDHVEINGGVSIGEDCEIIGGQLGFGVTVGSRTRIIGEHVELITVLDLVDIGSDVAIGGTSEIKERTTIGDGAKIGFGVRIGEDCIIEPGVQLGDMVQIGAADVVCSGSVLMHRSSMTLGFENPMVPGEG